MLVIVVNSWCSNRVIIPDAILQAFAAKHAELFPAVRRLLGLSTVELTDVAAAVHDVGLWADADDVDGFMDALDLGDDDRPAGRE